MEKTKKEHKLKSDNEPRSKLFDFYENIKKGNQIFSEEELEIAIETLKLAQQTIKQKNHAKNNVAKTEVREEEAVCKITDVDTLVNVEGCDDETLQLPSYNWFVTIHDGKPASNIFTGSCRKDTSKGHFSTTTFNYKVSVSNVGKENANFVVNCFWQLPWQKGSFRKNLSETEYECSTNGLNEATAWLNSEWQKFMEDDKNEC